MLHFGQGVSPKCCRNAGIWLAADRGWWGPEGSDLVSDYYLDSVIIWQHHWELVEAKGWGLVGRSQPPSEVSVFFDILLLTPSSHLSQLPVGHALSHPTPLCAPHHDALSQNVPEEGLGQEPLKLKAKPILHHPSGVLSQQWLRVVSHQPLMSH